MLDLPTIKKSYDSQFQAFDRSLVREYLQYQILAIIFSHPLSRKLSFLGGTCLRIVHQLPRFSEDIDFDNKDLTTQEFATLSDYIKQQLEMLGYQVEVRFLSKGAFHCYIKFNQILYDQGLTDQKREKILIQLDTFDQGYAYQPEIFILDKFEFFSQILVTPKSIILAQKLWTITNRPQPKGRDFFDIMFLLQTTQPDLGFLQSKFGQHDLKTIITTILDQLSGVNYQDLAKDVQPFLLSPAEAERIKLFPEFLRQRMEC